MYNKLLLFILIIFILIILMLIIFIHYKYNLNKYQIKDTFYIPDPTPAPTELIDTYGYKNGRMTFDFLKDINTTDVLDKYYLDDDTRINGATINYHPYRYAVKNTPVEGAPPYIYGTIINHVQRKPKVWNKYDTYAVDIYNAYGIRR